jgi:xanthine dehydrogenase molybdopterin-binding subunit B
MLKTLHDEGVYVEVRTHFDPYAKDKPPKFYYYVYRNSTQLVENDIEFINNRVTLFDDYNDCLNEAINIGLILII